MSATEYYLVWLLYLVASALALWCFWWLTQVVKHKTARLLLFLPVAAIAIMPSHHSVDESGYSPAIAAAALDFIANGWEGARPHVFSLLLAIAAALFLVLVIDILRRKSLIR